MSSPLRSEMPLAKSIDGAVIVRPVSAADKLERFTPGETCERFVVEVPAVNGVADSSPTERNSARDRWLFRLLWGHHPTSATAPCDFSAGCIHART